MKKTLITAAFACMIPTSQAIEEGYQDEIYKEAYKTLIKYKEVTLVPSVRDAGVVKVFKLKTRPFKKADHGHMKPASLEGWMVPVLLEGRPLWLSFKVEVLDFPKLGRQEATKEFHSIIDIRLVTSSGENAKTVKLKDKPEPALTKWQRHLISKAIVKLEEKRNKKFTAKEHKEQFEIQKKALVGQHKFVSKLEEARTLVALSNS